MTDRFDNVVAKLEPDAIRANLLNASLLITAFVLLRGSVIDRVKGFFLDGIEGGELKYSPKYDTDVLSRHKSPFRASLLRLAERGALSDSDLADIDSIRERRNLLAHDLPRILVDPDVSIDLGMLDSIEKAMIAVDRFFGEIEVSVDPDFDGVEVDLEGIRSLATLLLSYVRDVTSGNAT